MAKTFEQKYEIPDEQLSLQQHCSICGCDIQDGIICMNDECGIAIEIDEGATF